MSFSHRLTLGVFHWSLSDSKSPQFSRILLSILADSNNALVWMVSILKLISNSSPVPTSGSWGHFFFLFTGKMSEYLFIFLAFFYFHSLLHWNDKTHKMANSLSLDIS